MAALSFVRIIVAVGLASSLAVAGPASAEPVPDTRPQQHGRWLADQDGRALVLHGVNMVNKVGPYVPADTGFGADDAAFLAEQGFTTVRLGLIWKAIEPNPGEYDDAYLARIKETTELLAAEGIWTMLDFHQDLYHERYQGEGAPDWAVQDNGIPAQPQLGFPYNYLGMPALLRAFDNFLNNSKGPGGVGLQDRYAQSWRHVAEYFQGTPGVMGFDLFNEPWPGTLWALCIPPLGCPTLDAKLSRFSQRATDAIRTVDQETVVYYEPYGLFNGGAKTYVKVNGDNLGFSFHDYCVFDALVAVKLGLETVPCGLFNDMVWKNTESHVKARSVTPLLTEFGATDDLPTLQDIVDRAAKNRTGWQYWHYCGCNDPTTSGPGDKQALVRDPQQAPTGDNVFAEKLKILAVPHPKAVAGTPTAWAFDRSTGTFTLSYSATKVDGSGDFPAGSRTTVAVPALHYPDGYTATAEGATVESPANSAELVLESTGSGPVKVTVGAP